MRGGIGDGWILPTVQSMDLFPRPCFLPDLIRISPLLLCFYFPQPQTPGDSIHVFKDLIASYNTSKMDLVPVYFASVLLVLEFFYMAQ
jgi:hypothetical protein